MNQFCNKTKIALAVAALAVSVGAHAVPIGAVTIAGGACQTWLPSNGFAAGQACDAPNLAAALSGDGNVELSKFGGPVTTMTGSIAGDTIIMSSLVLSDWMANGNALATSYIMSAYAAAGQPLNAGQLTALTGLFLSTPQGYGRLSDPNVSSVETSANGTIYVGLDGFDDASPVLNALAAAINGMNLPGIDPIPFVAPGAQASEVVKVQVNGASWQYLYGFSATPTGYQSPDGSFSGLYSLQVPEPESLALLGIGLLGLCLGRRRRG